MSVKLPALKLEISITSAGSGATVMTGHGSDVIRRLSLAPFTAYTVEKNFVPERSLLKEAEPLVFFPIDLIDTTSHKFFAVPTHQS